MPFVLRAYLSIRIADHDGVQKNQIFGQSQRFGQFSTTFFRGVSPRSHSAQLYAGGSQENIFPKLQNNVESTGKCKFRLFFCRTPLWVFQTSAFV